MVLLTLSKKILATSLLLVSSFVFASDIGDITEHKGSGGITRDKESFETTLGLGVEQLDKIETANGRLKMTFVDDTVLRLTEHTEVILTSYYYDPNNSSNSKMAMNFVSGTARFATGRLGLVPRENIILTTPTATIAVRGTDFTTSVDELGRSLVILLPESECTIDGDCSPSGSIVVSNLGGEVFLTEAYQATMVSSFDQQPAQPVTLQNLSIAMIDNMFIVNPPREIREQQDETESSSDSGSTSLLDFNDLDTDYLADDYLAEDDLEFTIMRIDIHNKEKKIRIDLFDEYNTKTKTSSMARTTGYTCTACVNMLVDNMFNQKGLFPLELIGKNENCYNYIINYLEERGMSLKISEKNK